MQRQNDVVRSAAVLPTMEDQGEASPKVPAHLEDVLCVVGTTVAWIMFLPAALLGTIIWVVYTVAKFLTECGFVILKGFLFASFTVSTAAVFSVCTWSAWLVYWCGKPFVSVQVLVPYGPFKTTVLDIYYASIASLPIAVVTVMLMVAYWKHIRRWAYPNTTRHQERLLLMCGILTLAVALGSSLQLVGSDKNAHILTVDKLPISILLLAAVVGSILNDNRYSAQQQDASMWHMSSTWYSGRSPSNY